MRIQFLLLTIFYFYVVRCEDVKPSKCGEDPAYAKALALVKTLNDGKSHEKLSMDDIRAKLPKPEKEGSAYSTCFSNPLYSMCVDLDSDSDDEKEIRQTFGPRFGAFKFEGFGCHCANLSMPTRIGQFLSCEAPYCKCIGKNIAPECVNGVPGNCECIKKEGKKFTKTKDSNGTIYCEEEDAPKEPSCETKEAWFYDCQGCNVSKRSFANDGRKVCSKILKPDATGFVTFDSLKALLVETCQYYRAGNQGTCTMNIHACPNTAPHHPTFNYFGECDESVVPKCEDGVNASNMVLMSKPDVKLNICPYKPTYKPETAAGSRVGALYDPSLYCRNQYNSDFIYQIDEKKTIVQGRVLPTD